MPTTTQSRRDPDVLGLAERLYAAHRQRLLAIARHNSASAEEAEEALHDTFILFIDHFRPGSGAPPLAWLTLTLKRRCWALAKRGRRSRPGGLSLQLEQTVDPRRSPEEQVEACEAVRESALKLARLKPAERRALSLLGLGYSYREICEVTGWTYTKVNRSIAEGRAAMRRQDKAGPVIAG